MKLTNEALAAIDTPATRMKIAIALGKSYPTVLRLINQNHDDLTKAAALKIIEEETGLKPEQILETENA